MGKKSIKVIKYLWKCVLDVIYPFEYKCVCCGTDGYYGLCDLCKSKILRVKEYEEIISYGYYGGILKKLILQFKYEKNFQVASTLAQMLIELIYELNIKADYICYVPMSKKEIKRRGFNQCKILCDEISYQLNIPVSNVLKKNRETKEQKSLSKYERDKNVLGAFEIIDGYRLRDKNIILIDDVTTTGSTLKECKKIIENCNINRIYILTIAKSHI